MVCTWAQVLRVLRENWEDPLAQTVRQVQAAFELLVDVMEARDSLAARMDPRVGPSCRETVRCTCPPSETRFNASGVAE